MEIDKKEVAKELKEFIKYNTIVDNKEEIYNKIDYLVEK